MKDTSADSPAASRTRANPISWVTGRVTLATGSEAYSCTTSTPPRGSGVADGDGQLNASRGVDLDRAGVQILVAERGVGQAVSERERRRRVQVAHAVAVLPERRRQVRVGLATRMAGNFDRQLAGGIDPAGQHSGQRRCHPPRRERRLGRLRPTALVLRRARTGDPTSTTSTVGRPASRMASTSSDW